MHLLPLFAQTILSNGETFFDDIIYHSVQIELRSNKTLGAVWARSLYFAMNLFYEDITSNLATLVRIRIPRK